MIQMAASSKGWIVGVAIAVTALACYLIIHGFATSNNLASLALAGVVVLLAVLLVFTALMDAFGLTDKTQALGLPDGSVRALIALTLVGLFAILSSSVLQPSSFLPPDPQPDMSAADVAKLRDQNPKARIAAEAKPGQANLYAVTMATPTASFEANEFGKQMLTLVGTLMTALTAFYFGGRTAGGAVTDVSRAAPELTGVEDSGSVTGGVVVPSSGPTHVTFTGSNLNSIRTVRLGRTGPSRVEIEANSVLSNPARVMCTFPAREEFNTDGGWDVTVVDDLGRASTKAGLLTFKGAGGGSTTSPPDLKKTTVTSPQAGAADQTFRLVGSGLKNTKSVTVSLGGAAPVETTVASSSDTEVVAKPNSTLAAGSWTVSLTIGTDAPVELEQKLAIT
jgi:hypothetical protein